MRLTPRELGRREGAAEERARIARWLDERAESLRFGDHRWMRDQGAALESAARRIRDGERDRRA